jgi:zinc/manganese transport system permease protein
MAMRSIASIGLAGVSPTWDVVGLIQDLLHYPFMRNAFLAGSLIAVTAGVVGYFMVVRSQSFAGHTLANVGFAGAAGAVLVGASPVAGLLVFGAGAALIIGWLSGSRAGSQWRQEVAVGTALAFFLGLGMLFERLSSAYTAGVYAILFGAALGVSDWDIGVIALTTLITLTAFLVIGRPLLFASLDPAVAVAQGVPVRLLGYAFLLLLAFAVAQAVQVVGVLLIFSLLITPAAIAQQLTTRLGRAVTLGVLLALAFTWIGLAVAYYTPYPVGFFITSIAFGAYLLVRLWRLAHARVAQVQLGGSVVH